MHDSNSQLLNQIYAKIVSNGMSEEATAIILGVAATQVIAMRDGCDAGGVPLEEIKVSRATLKAYVAAARAATLSCKKSSEAALALQLAFNTKAVGLESALLLDKALRQVNNILYKNAEELTVELFVVMAEQHRFRMVFN